MTALLRYPECSQTSQMAFCTSLTVEIRVMLTHRNQVSAHVSCQEEQVYFMRVRDVLQHLMQSVAYVLPVYFILMGSGLQDCKYRDESTGCKGCSSWSNKQLPGMFQVHVLTKFCSSHFGKAGAAGLTL